MVKKTLTKEQVNKQYKGIYISFDETFNGEIKVYYVNKTSKTIRENMTLGEDVGTDMEYCR